MTCLLDEEDRDLALITPAPAEEEPVCLLSRWEGVCSMEEDDEDFGHEAVMAELRRDGTRVLRRSKSPDIAISGTAIGLQI